MKAVVTCDIIKSRQYSNLDRDEINNLIKSSFNDCCDLVPEANADKLSYSIIQGDEFQFLINKHEHAYKFVVFYRLILSQSELRPKFRAGIGIGDVSILDTNSYKMDGPAFHNSRDSINKLQNSKYFNRLTGILYTENLEENIDLILQYQDLIELSWTDKQKEAIYWYYQELTMKDISKKLGIAFQNVEKRINKANWKLFSNGMRYITDLLTKKNV